ncbi:MAG: hypothetical protein RL538_612, partial [Candidatus Parcubacteria bacterium]
SSDRQDREEEESHAKKPLDDGVGHHHEVTEVAGDTGAWDEAFGENTLSINSWT